MQAIQELEHREHDLQNREMQSTDQRSHMRDCIALRETCLSQLRHLMDRSPMYTQKDFALEERGVRHFAEKLQKEELAKNLRYIHQTSERLPRIEQAFRSKIAAAQARGWLQPKTAQHWIKKLHSSRYTWWEKTHFIENTFPHLLNNWQHLSQDIAHIKKQAQANPDLLTIPEVKAVLGDGIAMQKYKDWRTMVDTAAAKIAVFGKKRRTELLNMAQKQLDTAVHMHATTEIKAAQWIRRIFEQKNTTEEIASFVQSKLGVLTANWIEEKRRFDAIENRRSQKGSPRTFHFVALKVFLEYTYQQKRSYNDLAQHSIDHMQKSHALLLELKREVAAQDWATVEILLKETEKVNDFSESDLQEITSLRTYITAHRPAEKTLEEKAESQTETREDVEQDMNKTLSMLHPTLESLMRTFIRHESSGSLSACLATIANFKWCHEHNYLNPAMLEKLRQQSATETEHVRQQGDLGQDQMENLDLDMLDASGAHGHIDREYGSGTYAPTYIHVSRTSHEAFRQYCRRNESNAQMKYWVIVDFKEVSYADQLFCAMSMRHKIKSLKRRWDKAQPAKTKE